MGVQVDASGKISQYAKGTRAQEVLHHTHTHTYTYITVDKESPAMSRRKVRMYHNRQNLNVVVAYSGRVTQGVYALRAIPSRYFSAEERKSVQ